MKRNALIATLILTLAAGIGTAFAHGAHGGHGPGMSCHGGPGNMLRGIMRLVHRLDLGNEQLDAIQSIVKDARTQIQPHREALQAGREQMRGLDPSSFDEAAVRAIAQKQAKELEEIMVIGQKVRSQVWAVLTPEQRQEAEKIRSEMKERHDRFRDCMKKADGSGKGPGLRPVQE